MGSSSELRLTADDKNANQVFQFYDKNSQSLLQVKRFEVTATIDLGDRLWSRPGVVRPPRARSLGTEIH